MKDCSRCGDWRPSSSRISGVVIPGGTGKCIRPDGHCNPEKPRGYIEADFQEEEK